MSKQHWLHSVLAAVSQSRKSRRVKRNILKPQKRIVLQTENLEDRVVPTVYATPTYVPATVSHDQGSGPGGYFAPSDIQTAYGVSQLLGNGENGTGETIALIDAYDDPYIASDLQTFDSYLGLPDPTFEKWGELNNGKTFTQNTSASGFPGSAVPSGWDIEESLDVEWAHSMAPGATIVLVEADSASNNDLFAAADFAAKSVAQGGLGAEVVSMSFGVNGGFSGETSDNADFSPTTYPGVTFIASAGDDGSVVPGATSNAGGGSSPKGQAGFPADSPNVLAVGGTSLFVNGNYTYNSETVWNDGFINPETSDLEQATGGGISNFQAQPSYQNGVVSSISTTKRVAPDVAFLADPDTGVAIYDSNPDWIASNPTGWGGIGGTSLSAPAWAGLISISDQIRADTSLSSLTGATQTLPMLYDLYGTAAYSTDFNNITTGNNYNVNDPTSDTGYSAGVGYNAVTGLGTPIANTLMPYLATATSPPLPAPIVTAKTASTSQINLSWKSVKGATSYLIDESIGGNWEQIGDQKGTTFKVKDLMAGTTYSFEVAAVYSSGSSFSQPANVETLPAAPTVMATAVSSSEIDLSWSPVTGAVSYAIDEAGKPIGSVGITDFAVTGLDGGTTYSFKVAAVDAAGGETWGTKQSALTFPPAPTVTATMTSSTEIALSWKSVKSAKSYLVEELVGVSWQQIGSTSKTKFDVPGLTANTNYSFEVAAVNASGATDSLPTNITTSALTIDPNPTAGAGYSRPPASDQLFGANGPSYLDVEQGDVGDCWLIAGLAEVAAMDPQAITHMFVYDGTTVENGVAVGVYTVRFYDSNDVPQYVTVDSKLPEGGGLYDHPLHGDFWVSLAEKAYAVANGFGYVTTQNPDSNSYNALNGGEPSWVIQAVTGEPAGYNYLDTTQVADAVNAGDPVVLSTLTPESPYIVSDHAYPVIAYNSTTGMFTLLNPWGGTTSSPWCIQDSSVYGLFTANAAFVSKNFTGQFMGSTSAIATRTSGNGAIAKGGGLYSTSGTLNLTGGAGNNTLPNSPWIDALGNIATHGTDWQVLDTAATSKHHHTGDDGDVG